MNFIDVPAGNSTLKAGTWHLHVAQMSGVQWPLCVIASDEQISQPSLVWKQNSSHLHSLCVGILFNCTALGIHLCKTSQLYVLKTRLGGEIYSSDVNMHKGYSVGNQWSKQNCVRPISLITSNCIITDPTGLHKVLLPINHNYNRKMWFWDSIWFCV